MKRILKKFLVVTMMAFTALGFSACNVNIDLDSDSHACAYGIQSVGVENASGSHELISAMGAWETAHDVPTIYTYHLLDDCKIEKQIVIAENVYVGVCESTYELVYDKSSVVLPSSGNGGFFVYDCSLHGCYHNMDEALVLSNDYLEFALIKTNLEAAANLAEGETFTAQPLTIPAGVYTFAEVVDVAYALENNLVVFEDVSNTKVCLNNMEAELAAAGKTSQLAVLQEGVAALRAVGVTVNSECREPQKQTSGRHNCAFIPSYNGEYLGVALTQSYANSLTDMLAQMAAAGETMQPSENVWENYIFCYLVEDVTIDNAYPVPEGYTMAICKNGYDLECELEGNVFVYDCDAHVCLACGGNEMVAVYNDALRASYLFAKEVYGMDALPLVSGNYALMEALDLTDIKLYVPADQVITLCVNGFVDENEHAALENFIFEDENKTNFKITSCIYPISKTHQCEEISPHITALKLGEDGFAPYLNAKGEFITAGKGVEQAYALTTDLVLDAPIVIPSGANIQICLNGNSITWMRERKYLPYMFTVEYGASLTISDCSDGEYGLVRAYNEPNDETGEEGVLDLSGLTTTPVCNYGTFTLNSGNLLGVIGLANYGDFYMNGGTINGVMAGAIQAVVSEESRPLHGSNPSMDIEGGEINAAIFAVMVQQGDAEMENLVVNTGYMGIAFGYSGEYQDNAEIGNVTINVSESSTMVLKDMALGEINEEAANLLGMEEFVGLYIGSEIEVTGDINIEVEDAMLQPFTKKTDGGVTLVYPSATDIVVTGNGKLNIQEGVKFTDTFSIAANKTNEEGTVIVNQGLDDVFTPAEGFATCINDNNELIILSDSDADFMSYAQLESYNFNLAEGRLVFDFYCYFAENTEDASKGFLNNDKALVRIMYGNSKVAEFLPEDGEKLADGTYHFTVSFMAKDYQEKVKVQFTNGEYAWFGAGNMSEEYLWQNSIGAKGISVKEYLEGVIGFAEMYEEKYAEMLAEMEAYEEEIANLPAGQAAPSAPYTEELLAELAAYGPFLKEYKMLAEGMLAYCEAAAIQFGVEVEKKDEPINPITYSLRMPIAPVEEDDWTRVTAETLAPYQAVMHEGSVMPAGIQMAGITLVLEAYTNIRVYFNFSEGANISDYTFTLNGEQVRLQSSKKDNQAFLLISGLTASELKDMHTISISDGEDTFTFDYSAMSYMYTVLATDGYAETLKDLARAMWVYATRMENFLTAMGGNTEVL